MSSWRSLSLRIRRILSGSSDDSWADRTTSAGVWAFILSISTRILRSGRAIVLGRLLAPDDFGLMAVAILALELLDRFSKTGFDQALIQRRGAIEPHMNVAWTVALIRGLALGSLMFFAAPAVESFFDSDGATEIVRTLALVPIMTGFQNIGVVTFDRELLFRQRFMYRSVPHVVDLAVSVVFALLLRSAWALVLGLLARGLTMLVASYVSHPFRPRWELERTKVGELFSFGGWITLSSVLFYLMLNLDDIVVGRLLDEEQLGLYQMAFTIGSVLVLELTGVVETVAFPAMAMIQNDVPRLRKAFLRLVGLIAAIVVPATVGLGFLGQELIAFLLGEQWLPMLDAFRILLVWGGIRAIAETTDPLFKAMGYPQTSAAVMGAIVVILAVVIYPLTESYGIEGASVATVIASVPLLVALAVAVRRLGTGVSSLFKPLMVPIFGAAAMVATLVSLEPMLPSGGLVLLWAPPLGALVFAAVLWLAHRLFGYASDGLLPSLK